MEYISPTGNYLGFDLPRHLVFGPQGANYGHQCDILAVPRNLRVPSKGDGSKTPWRGHRPHHALPSLILQNESQYSIHKPTL